MPTVALFVPPPRQPPGRLQPRHRPTLRPEPHPWPFASSDCALAAARAAACSPDQRTTSPPSPARAARRASRRSPSACGARSQRVRAARRPLQSVFFRCGWLRRGWCRHQQMGRGPYPPGAPRANAAPRLAAFPPGIGKSRALAADRASARLENRRPTARATRGRAVRRGVVSRAARRRRRRVKVGRGWRGPSLWVRL